MQALSVIMIPLAGTVVGAAMALFMKKQLSPVTEKLLSGFAAGVMIAASVWSLIIPAIERSEGRCFPAVSGFLMGVGFLLVLDTLIPHLHLYSRKREGVKRDLSGRKMLYLAVTIHNFPEGMAVGAIITAVLAGEPGVSYAGAMILAIGIAIQNVPEGAIISMPLRSSGMAGWNAFALGALSGIAEPAGAVLTILIASQMLVLLPYCLAFAAGAMIYVVVDELIPEARSDECFNISTVGTALGFSLMMTLDVVLG